MTSITKSIFQAWALLLLLWMGSCRKFDASWDTELLTPLITSSIDVGDLFGDSNIMANPDQSLSLIYQQKFQLLSTDSLISFSDTVSKEGIVIPISLNLPQYNQFSELTYQTTFDEGSSLNNAMLWKLHFGGFIDQSLKDENLKRLQNTQNLLGSQAQFKLDFRKLPDHFLKNGNIGYSVGIQYNIAQELNFTQDLYHLIFYGNKSFEGQTAYLSPTSVQNYDFAQLNFGLFKKDRDRKSELSVELSLNLGFRYQYIEVNDAQLFTQNQGNALEYSGDVLFRSSQEEGTAFKPNGYGAGIHLWYEKQWKLKHEIKIGLYNLGFLWWNSKSSLYHQTKSATFQGVEIDNLFNFNNPLDGTTLSDSALNYLRYHSTNQSFWLPTQALLQLQYRYALTAKLGLETQLAHRFYSEYNTFLNVGLNRAFSPFAWAWLPSMGDIQDSMWGFMADGKLILILYWNFKASFCPSLCPIMALESVLI